MDDLAVIIMSMDPIHLGGIGLATVGCVGIMAYTMLKGKSSKNYVDEPTVVMEQPLENSVTQIADSMKSTIGEINLAATETTESPTSSTSLVVQTESMTLSLLDGALAAESSGNRNETIGLILEAMEQETHAKEKVRLHVIYKAYLEKNEKLSDLISRYPSFLQTTQKKDSVDLFAIPHQQNSFGVSDAQQAELEALATQAAQVDSQRESDDDEDTANFLKEFGDLAKQIKTESIADKKSVSIKSSEESSIHDVWANYMSLDGGRMNLKNTFVHLENSWGTISAIAELQEKINLEIGKDQHGDQIPWAIISVLPLR